MLKNDRIRIEHMLQAATEAINIAGTLTKEEIEEQRLVQLSLVRLIEIVGEAANKTSPETRMKYPTIPWAKVVGMRNKLVHGYDTIDYDIFYSTIHLDLPYLVLELRRALE